jgi:hypothetical protein
VQIKRTKIEASRKGKIALESLSRVVLPIEQAMNKQTPTGGVVRPITRLSTI